MLNDSALIILQRAADAVPILRKSWESGEKEFAGERARPMYDFELHRIGFFLLALSTECLLKCLWIGKNLEEVRDIQDQKRDLPKMTGHNLLELGEAAGLQFTEAEKSVLNALTNFIFWEGRYPAPLKQEHYKEHFKNGDSCRLFRQGDDFFSIELPLPRQIKALQMRLNEEADKIPYERRG